MSNEITLETIASEFSANYAQLITKLIVEKLGLAKENEGLKREIEGLKREIDLKHSK